MLQGERFHSPRLNILFSLNLSNASLTALFSLKAEKETDKHILLVLLCFCITSRSYMYGF